jgi:CRISPR-associated protein Cmr2
MDKDSRKMSNTRYIALTIGPILKTLGTARKTRELWEASYLFSFLMKKLVKNLINKNTVKNKFIVPGVEDIENTGYNYGAGLYPDRLIFRAEPGDFEKVKETVRETTEEIADGISEKTGVPQSHVLEYLNNYLHIYFLENELPEGKNPVLILSPYLDTMDLREKFILKDNVPCLSDFFKSKNKKKDFLFIDAFRDAADNKWYKDRFESLIEIASRELRAVDKAAYDKILKQHLYKEENTEEDESSVVQDLKKHNTIKKHFKIYHKYTVVVKADGDNIGETINEYGKKPGGLSSFSNKLMAFARKAARIIHDYGGTPVYIGGDDLLFFAPVVNRYPFENRKNTCSCSTVFDLVDTLDKEFKDHFPGVTISYGVSITYHKFPLNEALEQATSLLRNAKRYIDEKNGEKKEKNAIAFKILKHSGRAFGATFYKGPGIYTMFKNILTQYSANEKYLNSIVKSLQSNRGIFKELFENVTEDTEERIVNFFTNSFDEPIHDDYKAYIKDAAILTYTIYRQSPASWDEDRKFQAVYAVLRTLQFLNQEDNERL